MDRSWAFPVLLALSMALHGFVLLAATQTRPPRLYVHQGRFSVALRASVQPRSESGAVESVTVESPAVEKATSARAISSEISSRISPAPEVIAASRARAQPGAQVRTHDTAIADSGTVDVLPAPWADNPAPIYPERARRDGEQGVVTLRLSVLSDGGVGRVATVVSSGYALLDSAARRAAAEYHFEPAKRGGQAVDYDVIVPFEFRLRRTRWASKPLSVQPVGGRP